MGTVLRSADRDQVTKEHRNGTALEKYTKSPSPNCYSRGKITK